MMKSRKLSISLAALALGGAALGGAAILGVSAVASSAENFKRGASEAADARKAIVKRKADKAVKHAEAAVGFDPRNAGYRALLGQAYLLSGRFTSARQALEDALSLDPTDGRAALNLSLAQIAMGDWAGARGTLDRNADRIPAGDRGLAYALAGDPVTGVEILGPAAREVDATPKTRQNFALALALAGRWQEAKTMASIDVPADQIDRRIMDWAAFARPINAYDQVAALLGVRAIQDAGLPRQLALAPMAGSVAVAQAAPVEVPVPVGDPVDYYMPDVPAGAEAAVAEVQRSAETAPVPAGTRVTFAPRQEIVQRLPARYASPPAPVAVARATRPVPRVASVAKGGWFVQLGAYASAGVARDAWGRMARRVPGLGNHTPSGVAVSTQAGAFYRLSVGGFARADADALCREVRTKGASCFVRASTGDRVASWVGKGTAVAAR